MAPLCHSLLYLRAIVRAIQIGMLSGFQLSIKILVREEAVGACVHPRKCRDGGR